MEQQNEKWAECPQGSLLQLAKSQRKVTQQQKVVKTIAASSLFCVAIFIGYLGASSLTPDDNIIDNPIGESVRFVSCQSVRELMDPYFQDSLAEDQLANVEHHLKHCRMCHARYERKAESLGVSFSLAMRLTPVNFPILLLGMY